MLRKLFVICLLTFGMAGLSAGCAASKLGKTLKKEWKRQVKQLKADGWEVFGQPVSLETALEGHYMKMEEAAEAGLTPITIEGRGRSGNQNQARSKAETHAKSQLSNMTKSEVSSENDMEVTNEAGKDAKTSTKFVHLSHSKSELTIKNFTPTVSLCRKNEKGIYEAMLLYIVIDDK